MHEVFSFIDLLEQAARNAGKALLYFKPVGLDQSKDVDKINEVWTHYNNVLPPEIFAGVKGSLHNYIFVNNAMAAIQKAEEWFPFKGEMDDEYYVYVHIFDENGNSVFENERLFPPDEEPAEGA
jgi:hypothetical protein